MGNGSCSRFFERFWFGPREFCFDLRRKSRRFERFAKGFRGVRRGSGRWSRGVEEGTRRPSYRARLRAVTLILEARESGEEQCLIRRGVNDYFRERLRATLAEGSMKGREGIVQEFDFMCCRVRG